MKKTALCVMLLLLLLFAAACGEKEMIPTETNPENGSNNIPLGGLSILCEGMIYYVDEGENGGELLCAMTEQGEDQKNLYTPESNLDQIHYLNCDGTNLYFLETIYDPVWLGAEEQRIRKYNLQSGEITTLAKTGPVTRCLTYHGGYLYYTENGCTLSRISAEDGSGGLLRTVSSGNFVIYGGRIWDGLDGWTDNIVSYNLVGGDLKIHYKGGSNGVTLHAVHNGNIYFSEHQFEDNSICYVMDINGDEPKECNVSFIGDCNFVGEHCFIMTTKKPFLASDGDLTVEPVTEEERNTIDIASGSDLQPTTPVSEQPATASDIYVEGSENVRIEPGNITIHHYEVKDNGNLKRLGKRQKEGVEMFVETFGTISGNFRFYSIPTTQNGRGLYHEQIF
ncbi:MAG: DUF5050 domain-containing protein [Firmicutes bacterium]|nr:DUF5050 domain-containing protein [Bacillota bacterium]